MFPVTKVLMTFVMKAIIVTTIITALPTKSRSLARHLVSILPDADTLLIQLATTITGRQAFSVKNTTHMEQLTAPS